MAGQFRLDDRGVVVPCASCGQKNRTPYSRLNEAGTCGKCGAAIGGPDAPVDVESLSHFDALVRDTSIPVLVDFWAPWCGPCRKVAPEMVKVAANTRGRFLVTKVNTEALPELGQRWNVQSIPTMAVFVGGREASRIVGARPAAAIEQFVASTIGQQK